VQVKGPGGSGYLTGVTALAGGQYHSLAVKSDGTAWAWGYNGYGQLGDGTTTQRTTPVQVKGPGGSGYLTGVTAIAAGYYHSLAVKSDGTAWAWGYNTYGQLGDGTTTSRSTPVQVAATKSIIKHYYANGRRLATRDSEGLKFYHVDHLGSTSRVTNQGAAR